MSRKRKRIKILFVVDNFVIGGSETFLLRQIKSMDKNLFDIILAVSKETKDITPEIKNRYLKGIRYEIFNGNLDKLESLITAGKIDIIHTVQASPLYLEAAKRLNPSIRAISSLTGNLWNSDKKFNHREITDIIITKSKSYFSQISESLKYPAKKITIIENGIDLDDFNLNNVDYRKQMSVRKNLKINKNGPIITQVARLVPFKNIEMTLRIADRLRNIFPNIRFLIVGLDRKRDREYYKQLIAQRRDLRLEENISFTGLRHDIKEILSISQVVISTTKTHEGCPNSILEAMAMQRPIVSTRWKGADELIEDGKNGFIVDIDDDREFINKLQYLLRHENIREKMGKENRRKVRQFYNIEEKVRQYQKIYLSLLEEAPGACYHR